MSKRFYFNNFPHLQQSICKKHLGIGGFANVRVYECKQEHECGKEFVVKQLRHDYNNIYNKEDLIKQYNRNKALFTNEYEIGKQLNHVNIIKTLDMDYDLNCIVYENFIGTDMLDYLNNNTQFDMKKNLRYFSQVLDGMEYLHSVGIAHLDMKLENIVIDENQNLVKIIDFGYSVIFRADNTKLEMSHRCGTECYFPPEFHTKIHYQCEKVDMWCLGIVFYNLVFDRMPWEHSCSTQSKSFKEFEEYMRMKALHPGLFDIDSITELNEQDKSIVVDIFFGLLSINPNKRWSIIQLQDIYKTLSFLN
jgi:protein-serine/threonine kinase